MSKNKIIFIFLIIFSLFFVICSIYLTCNKSGSDTMPPFYAEDLTPGTDTHLFNGVYYMARMEKGLVSGYRDTDYFVEFFDDGTAMWWDYPEYKSKTFYSGSYTYNDNRECYMLEIEDHPTYIVTKDSNTVIITGGTFNNDIFQQSPHDNIVDAANDWWTPIEELRNSR